MAINKIFFALVISTLLVSCAGKKKNDDIVLPAEEIYNNSMQFMADKKYKKAIEGFEELGRTYPYSKWAIKAEIMAAYTHFKNEEYTDAVVILDKFIGLHPGNKDIQYAYYLKSICYYEQISDIRRDQSFSLLAHDALKEVIARFPESDYARDAQGKLDLVVDHLAGKEIDVGRFYLKQHKYISAINRFKEVLSKYQTTSYTPEALHRLVEANIALGLKDDAIKYAAVLGYNHPGSEWYAYSYKLLKGEKLEVNPDKYHIKAVKDTIRKSVHTVKNLPNLTDKVVRDAGKKVGDYIIGEPSGEENTDTVYPLKVQPTSNNRDVKVEAIGKGNKNKVSPAAKDEDTKETNSKGGGSGWFKSLNVPFVDKGARE